MSDEVTLFGGAQPGWLCITAPGWYALEIPDSGERDQRISHGRKPWAKRADRKRRPTAMPRMGGHAGFFKGRR